MLSLTILVGALTILFNAIVDVLWRRYRPGKFAIDTGAAMMLGKKTARRWKNSTVKKLEVEGRSLWQDARRRFMHKPRGGGQSYCPVSDSPCDSGAYAVAIYLFRYRLGHDVQCAGYGVRSLFRH